MADNVALSAGDGLGAVIATDDIVGVQYQIAKLAHGALDSATLVSTASGLPVQQQGTWAVTDGAGSLTVDNAALSVVGGGVEATALRVTVASDSTGVLSVDDNGGALTVDHAALDLLHTADFDSGVGTDNTPAIGIAVAADGGAAVITGDVANGLDVDVTRVSGTVTVTGAGGTFPVTDSGGSLTVDNAALAVVGGGVEATALRVTLASDSTGVVSVDDNGGALTVDWNGAAPPIGAGLEATALRVTVATDSTGVLSVDDNGGALTVDGTVAVTSANLTTIAGAVAGTEMQVDIVTGPTGASALAVQGTVAHDAAAAQNPVLLGARAANAAVTAVASADVTMLMADLNGKLVTVPYAVPELFVSGVTAAIVDTTRTAVIAAGAAGVRHYITHILVQNSHATVSTWVNIEDGVTTKYSVYAAATGGGASIALPVPLVGTAATAWNASCVTTGSNTIVSMSGYKGP